MDDIWYVIETKVFDNTWVSLGEPFMYKENAEMFYLMKVNSKTYTDLRLVCKTVLYRSGG